MKSRIINVLLVLVLAVSFLPARVQAATTENLSLYGDAVLLEDGSIQLTPLETWSSGSVWLDDMIDTRSGFVATFDYWAGGGRGNSYGGADGIALTFSTEQGLGSNGGYLGFVGNGSYGVELDSYPHNANDPSEKHVGIVYNTVSNHVATVADDRVDDSAWHNLTVAYYRNSLDVYLDDRLILSSDEIQIPDEIYLGISAATGAGLNRHLIRDFYFNISNEVHLSSGFTLGRDNNSFVHTDSASYNGAGFAGVRNYRIDDEYFRKLTANSEPGEKNRIKKDMQHKWDGSCYGIAMSMGLLYEGYIRAGDLSSDASRTSYHSMSFPSRDRKFLNMINYFQLSQGLSSGGKNSAAVSAAYNNGLFTDFVNWLNGYDSLTVFLKKLVDYCSGDHVELLGFSTKSGGHAVLITGCEYDSAGGVYKVQIYDENCIDSPSDIGEFGTMTISGDFSSFSYTDANGENINNNTFRSIFFLDWNAMSAVIDPVASGGMSRTRVVFPVDSKFTIEGSTGASLSYDGETISGSMEIYGFETEDYNGGSYMSVEIDDPGTVSVTDTDGRMDIEIYDSDGFVSVSGTDIESAVLDYEDGVTLTGGSYAFEAYLSTASVGQDENGLVSVSAYATDGVKLTPDGSGVDVALDGNLRNVTTGSYTGCEAEQHLYSGTGDDFTVKSDARIDGMTEITEMSVHFPRPNRYTPGTFVDVQPSDWFSGDVAEAYEMGLMVGKTDARFSPNGDSGDVTVAEAITIAARIHSRYYWGADHFDQTVGDKWYQTYLDYAFRNAIIGFTVYQGDVEQKITRGQFAEFLSKALPEVALAPINEVPDGSIVDVDSSSPYAEFVYMMYRSGVLTGTDNANAFEPEKTITRAETAAMISRLADSDNRVKF